MGAWAWENQSMGQSPALLIFPSNARRKSTHTTIQNKKSANFFKSKKKLKIFAKKSDFLFREWKKNLSKRKEERWMAEWSS